MEGTPTSEGHQLLITGAGGDQPLIMSPEDAAQFLAQAGLQLSDIGDSERIIIGDARQGQQEGGIEEGNGVGNAESLLATSSMDVGEAGGEINDGTVLYIDPNDPQAAALLQQAGLTLCEDGTVQSIEDVNKLGQLIENGDGSNLAQELFMSQQQQEQETVQQQDPKKENLTTSSEVKQDYVDPGEFIDSSGMVDRASNALEEASTLAALATASQEMNVPQPPVSTPPSTARTQTTTVPASAIQVGPDQQQVFYSVTGEDGKTQQYMMLCPKDMDQNTLIQTLVRQISSDPSSRGKKTIRITQQKRTTQPKPAGRTITAPKAVPKVVRRPVVTPAPQPVRQPVTSTPRQTVPVTSSQVSRTIAPADIPQQALSSTFDQQPQYATENIMDVSDVLPAVQENRVVVRCNYCNTFRSSLSGETWETILGHILPVCREEIQTTFYGDLNKHFIRSVRIQVNGKSVDPTDNVPQCEVVLTHSLVCRRTKKEFLINKPDANFIANLAKHIRMTQPGQGGRGNSLLCIFCNSPFTYEDYLRHIQPHLEAILATLHCFAGAYCVNSYETLRAPSTCTSCGEQEAADLRFLPCTKFSTEYHCLQKLQFGIECFRENYGDSGFMRLNTNHLAKCTVCKNPQQVYCAVFHITSTVMGSGDEGQHNIDSQLCVCVNCQKQFINIVMKEQGFEERLKVYQLRNMEQLCSCLRVILGQVKAICQDKKTLIYSVHENTSNANSTVHTVKGADVTETSSIPKFIAMAETEIAASPVKAFFVCDLCVFTVDLTSLIATPTNKQKNDMLLQIILEHIVPHTDSLMSIIANSASNRTFSLKFEVSSNVTDAQNTGQRKIVLTLRKKLHSQLGNNAEVTIDKDDETTVNAIRSAIKSERKSYVSVRGNRPGATEGPETPPTISTTTTASASQQAEVNKFIDKYKSRFNVWSQCGCNTSLLNTYMECRLCSKFCFPDFRLCSTGIEMCENCVETVLTLCLPSEPEVLEVPEECLALRDERNIGHRLVLSSEAKKWLSLDAVNLIKKTIEEFDRAKTAECSSVFSDGIRQHLLAVLKTCQSDENITTAVAGFCITDNFLSPGSTQDSETAAALASLQEQIGLPIKQADDRRRERQIEVKILARRPAHSTKKTPIPVRLSNKLGTNIARVIKNGTVIDLGTGEAKIAGVVGAKGGAQPQAKVIYLNTAKKKEEETSQEESVSAIQSFLEETSPDKSSTTTTVIDGKEVRVPAGIKITSAGKGVVNIRAVSDGRPLTGKSAAKIPLHVNPSTSTPKSVRGMKGVSMVTLTAGGVIKRVSEQSKSDLDDDFDEGDSDDLYGEEEDDIPHMKSAKRKVGRPKAGTHIDDDKDYKPPPNVKPKTIPILKSSVAAAKETPAESSIDSSDLNSSSAQDSSVLSNSVSEEPRTKRARKEKKIFDL